MRTGIDYPNRLIVPGVGAYVKIGRNRRKCIIQSVASILLTREVQYGVFVEGESNGAMPAHAIYERFADYEPVGMEYRALERLGRMLSAFAPA